MIAFLLGHALALTLTIAASWGAGSLVARRLDGTSAAGLVATRLAAGFATLGALLMLLGLLGQLTPVASAAVVAVAGGWGIVRVRDLAGLERPSRGAIAGLAVVAAPVWFMALYPPIAFDETLYHLPTIERFAATGSLPFIAHLRVPVFPHLDEVLRVPLFLLGGDVATHLLALVATLVTSLLMFAWFAEGGSEAAGWLAASLFVSSPLVVQLATTGYVEATLTMFVAAACYSFDRWRIGGRVAWLVAAGAFGGCAASVKYLGLFWLGALGFAVLLRRGARLRNGTIFAVVALLVLVPWYGRILWYTGNPLFPFASGVFGGSVWNGAFSAGLPLTERLTSFVRLPWDLVVARARTGNHPPVSPLVACLLVPVAARMWRNRMVAALAAPVAAYALFWCWMPADARYLEPAMPLAIAAGVTAVRELAEARAIWNRRTVAIVAIIAVLPGPLYALHRIRKYGALPTSVASREAWLARQLPEYGAIAWLNARSAATDVAWFCGGERTAYLYRGEMRGDHTGPARFELLRTARDAAELARRAASLGARFVVVVKVACRVPSLDGDDATEHFTKVYEDDVAVVWERRPR